MRFPEQTSGLRSHELATIVFLHLCAYASKSCADKSDGRSKLTAWRESHGLVISNDPGRWQENETLCSTAQDEFACIGNFSYHFRDPAPSNSICSLLQEKMISHIVFCGDSFMRHMYVAVLQYLTKNYKDVALKADHDQECEWSGQYTEKRCVAQIRPHATACNGKLRLSFVYRGWCVPWIYKPDPGPDNQSPPPTPDVVFWSGGNHPIHNDLYPGSNHNVDMVREHLLSRFCPFWTAEEAARVFFVSTHARLPKAPPRPHDTHASIHAYHRDIGPAVAAACGVTRFVDVYNMSLQAILTVPAVANATYDGVHWSRPINLVKARIMLHALLAHPPPPPAASGAVAAGGQGRRECSSSGPEGRGGGQCFRVVSPAPGDVIMLVDVVDLYSIVRVNCPHLPDAQQLLVQEVVRGGSTRNRKFEIPTGNRIFDFSMDSVQRGSVLAYRLKLIREPDRHWHADPDDDEARDLSLGPPEQLEPEEAVVAVCTTGGQGCVDGCGCTDGTLCHSFYW